MQGYNDGFSACSGQGGGSSSPSPSQTRTTQTNGGGFSQGVADGRAQGRADALAHIDNNVCGVEHSESYCAGYEIGYRAQHGAFTLLHPNQ
jgi:hypothetical protein